MSKDTLLKEHDNGYQLWSMDGEFVIKHKTSVMACATYYKEATAVQRFEIYKNQPTPQVRISA